MVPPIPVPRSVGSTTTDRSRPAGPIRLDRGCADDLAALARHDPRCEGIPCAVERQRARDEQALDGLEVVGPGALDLHQQHASDTTGSERAAGEFVRR